ncbi:MAG: hypothetical protein JWO42_75, partial [Chloroflexi bacterium]|nr:hypothetical protein [Chloroflexota bacterium]
MEAQRHSSRPGEGRPSNPRASTHADEVVALPTGEGILSQSRDRLPIYLDDISKIYRPAPGLPKSVPSPLHKGESSMSNRLAH